MMRSHVVETSDGSVIVERRRGPRRQAAVARVARVFDYAFGLLYTLLVVRLALEFFHARPGTGFVEAIGRLTAPFYEPFRGIFPPDDALGGHVVWSLVVTVVAYMILHAAIRGLLRLVARG